MLVLDQTIVVYYNVSKLSPIRGERILYIYSNVSKLTAHVQKGSLGQLPDRIVYTLIHQCTQVYTNDRISPERLKSIWPHSLNAETTVTTDGTRPLGD